MVTGARGSQQFYLRRTANIGTDDPVVLLSY